MSTQARENKEPAVEHCLVRPLSEADLDRVMEIELAAYPHPWTRGIFSDCLRVGYECWGMVTGSRLSGYFILTHAAGECHLLNLCIEPARQRNGLGSILLEHAIRIAIRMGCDSMFLEVRPSNPAALELYRKKGFHQIGQRPEYYSAGEGREDAIIMALDLATIN